MPAPTSRPTDPPLTRFRNQRFGAEISNQQPKQATFRPDSFDPVVTKRKGKGVSPFVFLMLILAAVVAFFGAGNLQQINTWGDAAARWIHANNDSLVGSVLRNGSAVLAILGGLFALLVVASLRNSARSRASEE